MGFTKSEADTNLYHILVEGKFLISVLYVDDFILAGDEHLVLVDDQVRIEIPVELLRKQADVELTFFAPFRGREVLMRGFLLDTLLKKYLSKIPEQIKLTPHKGV